MSGQPKDPRAERIRLVAGGAAVEIVPGVGGRISALEVDGWDLLRRHGWTDREWGAFVMAPWIGRLRDARVQWHDLEWRMPADEAPHALHGTVLDVPWTVSARGATSARLEVSLGTAWPFPGRLVQTVRLSPDRLTLQLEVQATADPFPAITGWHPWFLRRAVRLGDGAESGDIVLDMHAGRRVELDDLGLPTGALAAPRDRPVDDVLLGVATPPTIRWPGGPTLTLHAPGAAAWIAYAAHPDGLCAEPVTGLPDGLNGGLLGPPPVAAPGAPLVATFEIRWRTAGRTV